MKSCSYIHLKYSKHIALFRKSYHKSIPCICLNYANQEIIYIVYSTLLGSTLPIESYSSIACHISHPFAKQFYISFPYRNKTQKNRPHVLKSASNSLLINYFSTATTLVSAR